MREFIRRIGYLLRLRQHDRELANELDFHREMAAREGRDNLGNRLRLREESREAWGWTWLDRLGQDVRYAARLLAKSPGFTLTAVLMLALGIGVNVAAFGFFNLMVFSQLPVRDPDSLLSFQRRAPRGYASDLPYPAMAFYREHSRTLSAVLAMHSAGLIAENEEKPIRASFVTANTFLELDAPMNLGRPLEPRHDDADAAAVVVLSHGFWTRHFGANRSVIGQVIRLNRQSATIIGVASPDFGGLTMSAADVWLPIARQPDFIPGSALLTSFSDAATGVQMWGRMRPGMTPKIVEDELAQLASDLRKLHPNDVWEKERLASEPGGYLKMSGGGQRGSGTPESASQRLRPVFVLIGSLALLILAVACGNLGSLLLARGVAREREISIRAAVGAGQGRLVRQLFTESLLLAMAGSLAGLGLGAVVLRALLLWTDSPAWLDATPDWRVTLFAVTAGALAALLFGLTPALQVARQRHRSTRVRQVLIGAQVAASCVLLIVAGLLVRGLQHATSMDPGFEYQQVISISPSLADHGFNATQSRTYLESLMAQLRAEPGVTSVSLVSTAPLSNRREVMRVRIDDRKMDVHVNRVDPDFFETMKIQVLRGRAMAMGEKAVVISESLARFQWPGQDPLGKPFDEKRPIVGIARSARAGALSDPDAGEVYLPIDEGDWPEMQLIAKSAGPVETALPRIAALAKGLDAQVFPQVQTLKASFRRKLESTERSAAAVSLLGLTALLLASLGLVGLVSYAVSQRTKEIGIRLALGARPLHVMASVLRQFSWPVMAGLLAGVGGAAGLSQLLRGELYGISGLDPAVYVIAIALFLGVAILAALWPARRALRIDPLRALRYE
ncbi:MAG: ABC transporter permease [Bryobacteraceae bacterium]|nr:ABC transporter permease [Bryobacteraceae bacterium]